MMMMITPAAKGISLSNPLHLPVFFSSSRKVITLHLSCFPKVRHTTPRHSGNGYIYLKKKSAKVKTKQTKNCSNTAILKYRM